MNYKALIICCGFVFTLPSQAQVPDFEEAIRNTEITSQKIADNFHVLFGVGGNIAASIGEDGVLLVDDQFPGLIPKIKSKLQELGGGDIEFVINTHWHFDHADGNQSLGPEGALIVSQENSRDMMTRDNRINLVRQVRDQPAYAPDALPVITYKEQMAFHLNGQRVDLLHFGSAHTTGDTAIIFRGYNAVHMGDVFNNAGYPFIDADNGGSLSGIIQFCQAVLETIDQDTVVIPGHGPVAGYADMANYIEMLTTIRDRISNLIADGADLEQVMAAKPTSEWDETKGDPANFLNRSYASMKRQ